MSTAPFRDPEPFVLLPMRETAWQKLVRRAVGIFNRFKHKQRFVERAPKVDSALSSASQVGNYLNFTSGLAVNAYTGAGDSKANVNQANQMAERWSHLEGYNGFAGGMSYCRERGSAGSGYWPIRCAHSKSVGDSMKTWPWDIALALFLMGIAASIGVLIGMMVSMS